MLGFSNSGGRSVSASQRRDNAIRRKRNIYLGRAAAIEELEQRTLLSVTIVNGGGEGYVGSGGGGPPDITGAAGPNSYVQSSNSKLSIYTNKATGTPRVTISPGTFFFGASNGNLTPIDGTSQTIADVTMVYDNLMGGTGRFIIGNIDIDSTNAVSQYVFAVSKTNNPLTFGTSDWNWYHITTNRGSGAAQAWTDYPGNPGYNADAFVETFNMAQGTSLTGSAEVVTVNAADLAAGVSQASLHFFNDDIAGTFSYRATAMQDSAPGDPMWLIRNPNDGSHINVTKMTNVLSSSPTFTTTSVALPGALNFNTSGINNPLNSDGSVTIDGDVDDDDSNPGNSAASDVDNRILNASEMNNTIVAAHKVAVGTASIVSAVVALDSMGNPVGGSGYTVGDTLTVTGGTFTTAATLTVATLGAGGSVATVTVGNQGSYSSLTGISGAVTGGTGSGAKFGFNFSGQLDVQWYAINVSGTPAFRMVGGNPNVGRIGFGANTYAVEPSVAINPSGEIGLGFMESDTTGGAANAATGGFLSTFVTARKATDAAGTMQPIVLVSAGTGTGIITGRIGDFSGMNVDPANGTFWHTNEFGGGGPTDIANFTPEAPPTVTAPSSQTAVEGASKVINLGSFADPDGGPWSADVSWGDGMPDTVFAAAVGSLGTKTHTYAEEGVYTVTVTVTDNTGLKGSNTFGISVSDPAVLPTGGFAFVATEGVPSATQTVATFTDPGGPEAFGNYSAMINWGDGTAPSIGTISGPVAGVYTVTGSHTYAVGLGTPGDFGNTLCDPDVPSYHKPITVTISHEAAPTAMAISDSNISLPPASAFLASDGSLIIVGTTGDDMIFVEPVGTTSAVSVRIGSLHLGSFTLGAGGRIVVAGLAGNDNIQVSPGVHLDAVLYGGPGNDRIQGGGGRNIEIGCDGNDSLAGGNHGDLLVGGSGADRIVGGLSPDILVAGEIVDATNTEDDQYNDLVSILAAGHINPPFKAIDDTASDTVYGVGGNDIVYIHLSGTDPKDSLNGLGNTVVPI